MSHNFFGFEPQKPSSVSAWEPPRDWRAWAGASIILAILIGFILLFLEQARDILLHTGEQ